MVDKIKIKMQFNSIRRKHKIMQRDQKNSQISLNFQTYKQKTLKQNEINALDDKVQPEK